MAADSFGTACQIPDFRKITDDSHIRLCARIFGHLARGEGYLPEDWLDELSSLALSRTRRAISTR